MNLKAPWYFYAARVGLGIWLVFLAVSFALFVGEPRTHSGEPFTWWDVTSAYINFACTAWLGVLAGREKRMIAEFLEQQEKLAQINAEIEQIKRETQQ